MSGAGTFLEAAARLHARSEAEGDLAMAEMACSIAEAHERELAADPFPASWKPGRSEVDLYLGVVRGEAGDRWRVVCGRCLRVPVEPVALRAARVRPMRRSDFQYEGSVAPTCTRCGRRPLDE